jgi:hypothetical protein
MSQPYTTSTFTSFDVDIYRRKPPKEGEKPDQMTSAKLHALPNDMRYMHAIQKYIVTISIPVDNTNLPLFYTSSGTGTLTVETLGPPLQPGQYSQTKVKNAVIAWSAFSSAKGYYSLRGTLADAQSGTALGYIYASLRPGPVLSNIRISRNALAAIDAEDTSGPVDYWSSLPSCSNSGPFLPNGLSVLQQLPGGVSSALQQQR